MLMQPASSPSPGRKDRTAPSLELYPLHLGDCVIDSKQNRKPRKQQSRLRQWGETRKACGQIHGMEKREIVSQVTGSPLSCELRLVPIKQSRLGTRPSIDGPFGFNPLARTVQPDTAFSTQQIPQSHHIHNGWRWKDPVCFLFGPNWWPETNRSCYTVTPRKFGPPLVVGMLSRATGRPTPRLWVPSLLALLLSPSASALTASTATRCPSPAASSPAGSTSVLDTLMSLEYSFVLTLLFSFSAGADRFASTRSSKLPRTPHNRNITEPWTVA